MAVCIFEKPNNRNISTCQNFGHKLYSCQRLQDVFTKEPENEVIFCLDKQAVQEFGFPVTELHKFNHPEKATYVFGTDASMKMAAEIKNLKNKNYMCLTIIAPVNNVFWTDSAIAIILYDRWMKDEMGLA